MQKKPRIARPLRRRPEDDGRERRRALEAILRGLQDALHHPLATRPGSPDLMDAARETHDDFVRQAMLDSCRDMLAQVDEALHRLAAGKYGVCAECGEPIPMARLRALPFAVRCLPCRERFETQAGGGARAGVGALKDREGRGGIGP